MITGVLAMIVGLIAIGFAKFVMPKFQERIAEQTEIRKTQLEEKKRKKQEEK